MSEDAVIVRDGLAVREIGIESIKSMNDRMEFESARIDAMRRFVNSKMVKGVDYGVIPGTKDAKPVLWKPGAEIMCGIYRYEPEYLIAEAYEPDRNKEWTKRRKDGGTWGGTAKGRYEVRATCTLRHIGTGNTVGQGVGSCNSWEAKYVSIDIDDSKNTVLKMAQKRAYIAATLSACRLSAFFTQDLEDVEDEEPKPKAAQKPEPEVNLGQPSVQEPAENGRPTHTGSIARVQLGAKKSPDDAKRPWRLDYIVFEDGAEFGCFSSSVSAQAEDLLAKSMPVILSYKTTPKGNHEAIAIKAAF